MADRVITEGSTKSTHDNINWSSERNTKTELNTYHTHYAIEFSILRKNNEISTITAHYEGGENE